MTTTIIKFTVGAEDNQYRLVCGDPAVTGRNDVEKLGEDRTGKEAWLTVGYNKAGLPSAETLLQLALMRVITTHEDLCIDKDGRIVVDLGTLTGLQDRILENAERTALRAESWPTWKRNGAYDDHT